MEPIGSFSGLASGIQWRDMIDQIVAVDRIRQVNPLNTQKNTQQKRLEAWKQFQTRVAKLATAAKALAEGTSFDTFRVTAGTTAAGRALISATASESAAPGTYTVEVLGLARAEKLSSAMHVSTSEALGLNGRLGEGDEPLPLSFTINGVTVEIEQHATLGQIRDAINEANTGSTPSGVSATILTTGTGEHRLILTADGTGAGGIDLVDGEDGALEQLGIAVDSRSVQLSGAMEETPSPLAALLGLSAPPESRVIVINGVEVSVDLSTDTLTDLLDKVKAAASAAGHDPDGAARIAEELDGEGQTVHRLEVRGSVVGKLGDEATNEILDALGFTRDNLVTAGSDAQFRIDGFDLTRRTNTVSDALAGVTINLNQAEAGSPVELRITADQDAVVNAVKAFATAYNDLQTFVREVTASGQPLANNSAIKSAVSAITGALLTNLEGTEEQSFTFERATLVGVTLSRTGTLEVDSSTLKSFLTSNPHDVRRLFAGFEDGPDGVADRIGSLAETITRSGDGLVAMQSESLQRSIDSLERRVDNAEARLEVRQASLIRQFTRMEEALSKLQAQSSWLTSQIQALQQTRRDA